MQRGFFRPVHGSIGKSTHSAGFLFRHANYVVRPSASPEYISVGVDADRDAFLSYISTYQHYAYRELRANARLADTFQLSLIRGLQPEHHREVLSHFANMLTQERAVMFISIHTDRPDNPHAHAIFIDRDIHTGKPVAMLSHSPRDRAKAGFEIANGTEYIRALWAQAQNDVLERHHYDIRVDPRHMAAAPDIDVGISANAPDCPDIHLAPEQLRDDMSAEQDDDMVEEPRLTGADTIRAALRHDDEVTIIDSYRTERARLTAELDGLTASLAINEAGQSNAINQVNILTGRLQAVESQYAGLTGGLLFKRGLHVKAFGLEWKSKKRMAVEGLEGELSRLQFEHMHTAASLEEWRSIARQTREAIAEKQRAIEEHDLRLLNDRQIVGTDKELDEAEQYYTTQRQRALNWSNAQDVQDYYELGQISAHDAQRAFRLMGRDDLAQNIQQGYEIN